jgi:hypothetical protein
MTQFRQEKDFKKCTFGESYEQIKPRVDIDDRKILTQITFERVGPSSYTPLPERIKREPSKYSCGIKLPSVDDFLKKLKPNVSPSQYNIKDDIVKQTRFSKILVGGTMPKDGLIIDKNPGVGQYE